MPTTDNSLNQLFFLYALIGAGTLYILFIIVRSTMRNYKRLKMQKQLVKEALERNEVLNEEFLEARKKFLLTKADEAGVDVRWRSVVKVYGMAMDWKENGHARFFVAFQNGKTYRFPDELREETSDLRQEIRNLIADAAKLKKYTQFTIDTSLPAEGEVKFWLLTTDGVHMGRVRREEIKENNIWWGTFHKASLWSVQLSTIQNI